MFLTPTLMIFHAFDSKFTGQSFVHDNIAVWQSVLKHGCFVVHVYTIHDSDAISTDSGHLARCHTPNPPFSSLTMRLCSIFNSRNLCLIAWTCASVYLNGSCSICLIAFLYSLICFLIVWGVPCALWESFARCLLARLRGHAMQVKVVLRTHYSSQGSKESHQVRFLRFHLQRFLKTLQRFWKSFSKWF